MVSTVQEVVLDLLPATPHDRCRNQCQVCCSTPPRHAQRGMLMDICLLSVSGWPGAEPRVAVSHPQSGAALRVEKKTLTETLVSKWSLLLEVVLLLRRCRDELAACFTAGCQVVSLFMCLGAKVRAQAFFYFVCLKV